MKACNRCNGRLDSAARAARSETCTSCGFKDGDCFVTVLLPMTQLRPHQHEDVRALVERMDYPM